MSAEPIAAALEKLELKLAFLERANQDLSDVVYAQQQELDTLKQRLKAITDRMQDATSPERAWTQEEERPPHY